MLLQLLRKSIKWRPVCQKRYAKCKCNSLKTLNCKWNPFSKLTFFQTWTKFQFFILVAFEMKYPKWWAPIYLCRYVTALEPFVRLCFNYKWYDVKIIFHNQLLMKIIHFTVKRKKMCSQNVQFHSISPFFLTVSIESINRSISGHWDWLVDGAFSVSIFLLWRNGYWSITEHSGFIVENSLVFVSNRSAEIPTNDYSLLSHWVPFLWIGSYGNDAWFFKTSLRKKYITKFLC